MAFDSTTTFSATFYNNVDTTLSGAGQTGAAFLMFTNGTDSRLLFDTNAVTANDGTMVEVVQIVGASTLTVASTDLGII